MDSIFAFNKKVPKGFIFYKEPSKPFTNQSSTPTSKISHPLWTFVLQLTKRTLFQPLSCPNKSLIAFSNQSSRKENKEETTSMCQD